MRQIQIGSIVRARGERLLRRVLTIKDDHAYCESIESGLRRWVSLAQLSLRPLGPPLKTYLL